MRRPIRETAGALALGLGSLLMASSLLYMACDSSNSVVKETNPTRDSGLLPDGALPEGGPDGAFPDGGDCFMNPKTHFEIINACTDAVKITKNPTLARQLADGGLPPLP